MNRKLSSEASIDTRWLELWASPAVMPCMDLITAIHTLEALQSELPPGSDRARALQAGIEALWAQLSTKQARAQNPAASRASEAQIRRVERSLYVPENV